MRKSFRMEATLKSSFVETGPGGGTAGFSLVNRMETTAESAAMTAKIISRAGSPEVSATTGAMTIGRAKPTYWAMVRIPAAVALSLIGNQLAGTFVEILSRKGCPMAMRNWDTITRRKLSAKNALVRPKRTPSAPPRKPGSCGNRSDRSPRTRGDGKDDEHDHIAHGE